MPYDKKVSKLKQKKISYNQAWESSDDAYKAKFGGDTAEGKAKAIEAMKDYNKTHSKHYSTLKKVVTRLNNDKSLLENVRNKPTDKVVVSDNTSIKPLHGKVESNENLEYQALQESIDPMVKSVYNTLTMKEERNKSDKQKAQDKIDLNKRVKNYMSNE